MKKKWIILLILAVILVLIFLFYFDILNLSSDKKSDSLEGALASLWSGNPLIKVNTSIVNISMINISMIDPKCTIYSLTYKSGCLNMGYCLCDDFYNQCYSTTLIYRDKDFATCRSKTFPTTINGKYFRTLTDCENAIISATYTDRNNCKISYGWYGGVNNCYKAFDEVCKKVFGY